MYRTSSDSIEYLLTTITPFALLFFIFGIVAFIVCIAYVIRLWLVQTATFQLQRDVQEIRNHILGENVTQIEPTVPQKIDDGNVQPVSTTKRMILKTPRKVFVWISIAIPVLLICLLIVFIIF